MAESGESSTGAGEDGEKEGEDKEEDEEDEEEGGAKKKKEKKSGSGAVGEPRRNDEAESDTPSGTPDSNAKEKKMTTNGLPPVGAYTPHPLDLHPTIMEAGSQMAAEDPWVTLRPSGREHGPFSAQTGESAKVSSHY